MFYHPKAKKANETPWAEVQGFLVAPQLRRITCASLWSPFIREFKRSGFSRRFDKNRESITKVVYPDDTHSIESLDSSLKRAEVRVPRPRKKPVLMPLSFLFSHHPINRRKKEELRMALVV